MLTKCYMILVYSWTIIYQSRCNHWSLNHRSCKVIMAIQSCGSIHCTRELSCWAPSAEGFMREAAAALSILLGTLSCSPFSFTDSLWHGVRQTSLGRPCIPPVKSLFVCRAPMMMLSWQKSFVALCHRTSCFIGASQEPGITARNLICRNNNLRWLTRCWIFYEV